MDEAFLRSGKEQGHMPGTPLGAFSLRSAKLQLYSRSKRGFPIADVWLSAVWENQAVLCALKSPTMRMSSS